MEITMLVLRSIGCSISSVAIKNMPNRIFESTIVLL
jgi:hypothetical protein